MSIQINQVLFEETTHSPSLIDLVGYEEAQSIVDFCFIANPYYPTADMISQLQERLPVLIKHYPSSNTTTYTEHVAQAIGVDPAHLIMGNGATELITIVCECILENLGVAIPTFSEYVEKMEPEKVHLYSLSSDENYQLDLDHYLVWLQQNQLHAALIINPGNPTGQTFSLVQLHEFLHAATWMDMVIVDESFIDFADEEIPSLLHTAEQFSNLLVLRSMSKHCGVPGLRLGYCYTGNQELVAHLRHVLPTWNLNTLAEFFFKHVARNGWRISRCPPPCHSRCALARDTVAGTSWLLRLSHGSQLCTGAH